MPLPDNETLKTLLAASTPGPWQIHEEHDPACASRRPQKCNCEGVIEIMGPQEKPDTYEIVAVGELSSSDVGNLRLLVHGREMAAELIALREQLADPDVVLYCAYLAKSRALAAEVAPIQAAFEAGDESQREPFLAKLGEFLLVESLENERRAKGILLTQIAESQLSMLKMLEAMSRKDKQLAERLATVEGELTAERADHLDTLRKFGAAESESLKRLLVVRDERDAARAEAARLQTECETGAALVLELQGERDELQSRIDLALEILDDPADHEAGICRATEALWGEKPEVPAQVGGEE